MARDYEDIINARTTEKNFQTKTEVLGLPDGYIHGGELSKNTNGNIYINPMVVNVAGRRVTLPDGKEITGGDWIVPQTKSRWYYLYINLSGSVYVDSLEPAFDKKYMADYSPRFGDRYLGKFYYNELGRVVDIIRQGAITNTSIDVKAITAKDLIINSDDVYSDDDEIPDGDEFFDFSTPDCISNLGRNPYLKKSVVFAPGVLGTTKGPYRKWDGRGVVGFFREYENKVATPDLNDSTEWNHSASYHANQENVYDEDLDAIVWYWERGTNTTLTFVYDSTNDPGAAGTYFAGIWIKAEESLNIHLYIDHGGGSEHGTNQSYDPNDGWVWFEFWETFTNDPTGFGFRIASTSTFSAGAWFKAAMPIVVESPTARVPYRFPKHLYSGLTYYYTWGTKGTIEFWVYPKFTYTVGQNTYFVNDYVSVYSIICYYDQGSDQIRVILNDGTTTVVLNTSAYTSDSELQDWMHLKFTWDFDNDNFSFYRNGVLIEESSTVMDGTAWLDRNNGILSIGSNPEISQPWRYPADSWMTDFRIIDYVDKSSTHYEKGRPYFEPNEIVGNGRQVRISEKGIRLHDNSLAITDTFGRYIELSNAAGMLAEDSSGTIIHDIPDAPILTDMKYGGHILWKDAPDYITNTNIVYTDTQTLRNANSSIVNFNMTSHLPPDMTNVKGFLFSANINSYVSDIKVGTFTQIRSWAIYGTSYNSVGTYNTIGFIELAAADTAGWGTMQMKKRGHVLIPAVKYNDVLYIVYRLHGYWSSMASASGQYNSSVELYLLGYLV